MALLPFFHWAFQLMKSSYASKPCISHMLDREEHEKYLFLPLYGNMKDSVMIAAAPTINKSQWKGEKVITLHFQCCLSFYRTFKAKDKHFCNHYSYWVFHELSHEATLLQILGVWIQWNGMVEWNGMLII